jgi:D-3-phosphoglycerate dehydrogenase
MINKDSLKKAKTDLVLINTSRGAIVKEEDIISLINDKLIGAYGTDVIENENDDIKKSILINEMKSNKKIIVTPHVGGMTIEGQTKAYTWAINKL